jgi:hypothetical protein
MTQHQTLSLHGERKQNQVLRIRVARFETGKVKL